MEKTKCSAVCVTGGGGYLGSWLVRKLLKKGYVVHATLRDLGDESKAGLLKSFAGADERLRLFHADIYDADSFEPAIKGCVCVFLVATPLLHSTRTSPDYIHSKTKTEKELFLYSSRENKVRDIQVVSLACGLVGGDTCLPYVPGSMTVILSPLTHEKIPYKHMKLLQTYLGSIPLVHVDDVCEAHIFCMENASNISERFICASSYPTMHEIVTRYEQDYADAIVLNDYYAELSVTKLASAAVLQS